MLITNNVIYGEKSGYLAVYNNDRDMENLLCYISKVEDEIDTELGEDNQLCNLNRNLPCSGGINLSDSCQLRCNYCAYCSGGEDKNTLSFNQVKKYIDFLFRNAQIKSVTCGIEPHVRISFTGGGEPTFNWALFEEVINYAKALSDKRQIKLHLSLTTNGMLSDNKISYIAKNIDFVLVSYDGIAEVQNENRHTVEYGSTNRNVENSIKSLLNKGSHVTLRTTVWPHQYHLLNDMRDNIFENFDMVRNWEINPVNYVGRAQQQDTSLTSVLDFYKYYYVLKCSSSQDICQRIFSPWFNKNDIYYLCGTAFGSFPWLNSDGRIISCIDGRDNCEAIGWVCDDEIKLYDYYDSISINHKKSIKKKCYNCVAYIHCGGGCPLKNKEIRSLTKEQEFYSEVECINKKKYWEMMINEAINGKIPNDMQLIIVDKVNEINIYKLTTMGVNKNDKS